MLVYYLENFFVVVLSSNIWMVFAYTMNTLEIVCHCVLYFTMIFMVFQSLIMHDCLVYPWNFFFGVIYISQLTVYSSSFSALEMELISDTGCYQTFQLFVEFIDRKHQILLSLECMDLGV